MPTRTAGVPPLLLIVVITAVLYLARDLLIPLALAILLSFLLAPGVARLEHWRLGRVPATVAVVLCSFLIIGALSWVVGHQLIGLANRLPEYKNNIRTKIEAVRDTPSGSFGRAAEAIRELGVELGLTVPATPAADPRRTPGLQTPPPARGGAAAPEPQRPVPVEIQPDPMRPLALIGEVVSPLLAPLGTAAAVIIFTILMLLQREDLRDRLIRLVGQGQINVTTQAIEEAADRVSRYLRMQLIVNVSYGVPVGIALYLLDIPNAPLWGLLATVLRFIPYVGPWIAAAFPIALAFAIGDGWSLVLWTIAVFAVLETVSNNIVEPWFYGASTGLSAFAIIASAIFWTWLWGAVGLLLATPLTVCVAVLGRYIPQMAFLEVILGDEPVLDPHARLYQRLLARDEEEATEIAETFLREHSLAELYEQVILPALDLAEQDRHRDVLDEARARQFFDSMHRLLEMLAERPAAESAQATGSDVNAQSPEGATLPVGPAVATQPLPGVLILPARDEADDLAGMMMADLLAPQRYDVSVLRRPTLVGEMLERVAQQQPTVVCISALPPHAAMHAGYLCKRLRTRFPEIKIMVALWNAQGDLEKARARLQASGMDQLVTTLAQADEQIRELALRATLANQLPDAAAAEGLLASTSAPI